MGYCTYCGQALAGAAYCPRCGTPAAAPARGRRVLVEGDDTAERPAVVAGAHRAPEVPSPSLPVDTPAEVPVEPPSNARFPLFADEVAAPAQQTLDPAYAGRRSQPSVPRLPLGAWLALGALAAFLLVLVGLRLLSGGSDDPDRPSGVASSSPALSPSSGSESPEPGAGTGAGPARDLTADVTVVVPAVAPPNQDVNGRPVTYGADHLVDGDPATTWRMPGDGSGVVLVIRLPERTAVTSVGLVNGYAKTASDGRGHLIRWYLRNRRVTEVRWSFDDGSVVQQRLDQRPRMQTVDVGREVTRTIRLRLVRVTGPLPGPLGRNYTAISELRVLGAPAG